MLHPLPYNPARRVQFCYIPRARAQLLIQAVYILDPREGGRAGLRGLAKGRNPFPGGGGGGAREMQAPALGTVPVSVGEWQKFPFSRR